MMTSIGGAFQVPDFELRGEFPMSNLSWLYLAMTVFCVVTFLKALLEVYSDIIFRVKTHDLTFNGWIW